MRMPTTVYHPYVPSGSTNIKTKNFTFFQALRQTLAESEGLSAGCLNPRVFNGFGPPYFVVCTRRVYQSEPCLEFESHLRISNGCTLTGSKTTASAGPVRYEGDGFGRTEIGGG